MNWASPGWLLWVFPLLALSIVVAFMGLRHLRRLKAAFGELLYEQVLPSSTRMRRGTAAVATLLGLALVIVSLAEPRFDKQIRSVQATGVDIVLVLDLSRSMDAKDVEPSRLERARREISDLFRVLQGDRVGLVVFAGGAWPRLPLTEDLAAVQLVLSEADTSTFDAQGSALGDAIRAGVDLVSRSDNGAGRALLVLSDGEIHEGDDALGAAAEAAEAGVAIYTMGIGEEAAPIPVDGGWLAWNNEQVLTTPDESVLQEVARTTGGAYVKSVASPKDVVGLYEGEMRRKLKAVARDAAQREVWRSAFQWPLGLGLMLLIGAAWLGDGRRHLGAAAAALFVLAAMGTSAPAMAATLEQADQLYQSGRYSEAADALTELSLQDPTDSALYDRLGAARYRAGDFEGAARAWDSVSQLTGGDTKSLYNSGNAHWRAGRLEQAADRFSKVLGEDPLHEQARQNAEILAKELDARRNQPPPPPPEPEPSPEEQDDGGGEESEEQDPGGEGDQDPQDPGDGGEQDDEPQEDPEGEGSGTPEPQDLQEGDDGEDGDNVMPEQPSEQMGEDKEITEGQAERMLDAVDEGSQRVRVRGQKGNKPW